jgi:hypothetical protein
MAFKEPTSQIEKQVVRMKEGKSVARPIEAQDRVGVRDGVERVVLSARIQEQRCKYYAEQAGS